MKPITIEGFLLRFLFALLLVMLTYNPSGYSYLHWVKDALTQFSPLLILSGVTLTIGWVVYIRATLRSLGVVGLVLAVLFFSTFLWLFIDWGWLGLKNVTAMSWVILILISAVLAVGITWSHIRRKWTGQVDSDDVDEA